MDIKTNEKTVDLIRLRTIEFCKASNNTRLSWLASSTKGIRKRFFDAVAHRCVFLLPSRHPMFSGCEDFETYVESFPFNVVKSFRGEAVEYGTMSGHASHNSLQFQTESLIAEIAKQTVILWLESIDCKFKLVDGRATIQKTS